MITPLHSDSPMPLHYQLEQALKLEITSGRWKPGEMIPSERQLMHMADVSRATVRQALASLIQQGLLESFQGRGTFVAHPRYEQEISAVYSFSEHIAARGLRLEDRVLQREVIPAPADLAALLGMVEGDSLIHFQRLRVLENVPIILDNTYFPYELCPGLLAEDVEGALYHVLSDKYHLPPLRAVDTLECVLADHALAFHLRIEPGEPIIYIERVAYTHNDLPLHIGRNHVIARLCKFRVNLLREPASLELKTFDFSAW